MQCALSARGLPGRRHTARRALAGSVLLLGSVGAPVGAQIAAPDPLQPHVTVVKEFVDDFDEATSRNALAASVNRMARAECVIMPAISLHPGGEGDSAVRYAGIAVPLCEGGRRALILFRIGMSDGIQWDHAAKPNGVRFSVAVEGEARFEEALAETCWRLRVVDLTPWAGRKVAVEFRTNAIDGNLAYDWALFGRPRLLDFLPVSEGASPPPRAPGLALAEVSVAEAAKVEVSVGDATERAPLAPGRHLVPVAFGGYEAPSLKVASGAAKLEKVWAAPYAYRVRPLELALASPLVTAGRAFRVLLPLGNESEGLYPGGETWTLEMAGASGRSRRVTARTPEVPAGAESVVRWEALSAPTAGDYQVSRGSEERIRFHVYPPEPRTPRERPTGTYAKVLPRGHLRALAGNKWSRLGVVLEEGRDGYAIAETWNGKAWQRAGSLYPLARVVARDADGSREELALRIVDVATQDGAVVLRAEVLGRAGVAGSVRVLLRPEAGSPRIRLDCELAPARPLQLLAFAGPTLLAGDRAYGVRKEFALFPGLEYLEGDEPSSSTRDLAPPLHDRRVPAPTKIAAPLMAVQAQGALAALLWDPLQAWLPGERCPAARFEAPPAAGGRESCHLSLFVPSVGEHVRENEDEAATPLPLAPGQTVRLSARVVLDHEARYPGESVVRGPHCGGLVLQAMQHWFDAFGMPEPSPQPRAWPAQRALMRTAYLKTLWSDDPPGWIPHLGEAPQTGVALSAPLLLERLAGISEEVDADVKARVSRVAARAAAEKRPVAPVHGNQPLLQYWYGGVPEALETYRAMARGMLGAREKGLWVWRPAGPPHSALGVPGTHTLGQATYYSLVALRAALYTGDPELAAEALAAMRQMERYDLPRGASMWECPQYQPDIFATSLAVKAYCAAYRLTGDAGHLEHARYWAWTGLTFLYTWELPNYPTMRYNTMGVVGSTFFTHSWIGRPVVWMGLDYAYALQDLAEVDGSFPWRKVAQGITNSAMWQQYTSGKSEGCYPDSWEMATNGPNPADIHPNLIALNGFRLRGLSLDIRVKRVPARDGTASFSTGADIESVSGSPAAGRMEVRLRAPQGSAVHSVLAPVPLPAAVEGSGERVATSADLDKSDQGWYYHEPLRAVVLKHPPSPEPMRVELSWWECVREVGRPGPCS